MKMMSLSAGSLGRSPLSVEAVAISSLPLAAGCPSQKLRANAPPFIPGFASRRSRSDPRRATDMT